MSADPGRSFHLSVAYGSGKTCLLYAQCRQMAMEGKVQVTCGQAVSWSRD